MALNQTQQVLSALQKYSSFLIALPKKPTTDAISAALALFQALEKTKKRVKVVSDGFISRKDHGFLPRVSSIETSFKSARQFIINLDLTDKTIDELNYDIKDNMLSIFITPAKGFFADSDVQLAKTDYTFEAAIIINSPDWEHLGAVYENNTDFFYQIPVINIDHNADNEQFGRINLVDINSGSCSEIVFQLIQKMGDDVLSDDIATDLLAGIIAKTRSFQTPSVTPQVLTMASQLISAGGRREEIMAHLYHSKPFNTLKLWGRVLARLQVDSSNKILWSLLQKEDFVKAGADEDDLDGVIDQLLVNLPNVQKIMVLYENSSGEIRGIINTPHNMDALKLFRGFEPEGSADMTKIFIRDKQLKEAEKIVLERLRTGKTAESEERADSAEKSEKEQSGVIAPALQPAALSVTQSVTQPATQPAPQKEVPEIVYAASSDPKKPNFLSGT